ncbi:RNase H-like domain found in reverse transcriptase [Popillia japonica]|uniref:RNA-directed DNA polymerase n=1 Tax=Popillia japonica TaxID=7064 RepID=A0AAW1KLS5_POPJA
MESRATIVWQDGTEEKDIPTTQLYYSISLDDHEFFPGEWVVMATEKEETGKYGAVQNVNYLERTAMVKWFTYLEAEQKPQLLCSHEISVYDLKKHSKYAFRPGSIVKRKPLEENKLGYVIDSCPEGYVIVLWIDNVTENCWPQNIELLPETIDYDYSYDDNDDRSQNMAARLDFVRNRIVYLKEAFRQHNIREPKRSLPTTQYQGKFCFLALKSRHYQALMAQVKERAKGWGVELRGRLFSIDNQCPSTTKAKAAEKENINKVVKLEHKINAQIESCREGGKEAGDVAEPSTPMTPDPDTILMPHDNLCVELLSMLKARMDLAYAEIISRIGGTQALSVMTKASEANVSPSTSTPVPSFPTTPDDSFTALSPPKFNQRTPILCEKETGYSIIEEAPATHRFYGKEFEPTDKMRFFKAVHKECKLLRESLPPGVWVRSYSNRLDLLSVMIRGPNKTPYEDGLFLFDLQLSPDYPRSPPVCHYISYSSERLNPNLYVEGRVCVSLLGTWTGRGTEVWGPNSTLLQLIVSIQGLILVSEPYYNEAGYEKQTESQQGYENSRTYNELVILKLVQSMTAMLLSPPEIFKTEIYVHFLEKGMRMYERLKNWTSDSDCIKPEFPLLPVSKDTTPWVRPSGEHTLAITNYPQPRTTRELISFIGLASYFRKFVRNFSVIAKPLYDVVKRNVDFYFGPEQTLAFNTIKNKLSEQPVLSIYSPTAETQLHCDASALGFAGILLQKQNDGKFHPISYFSQRTTKAESKLHSFELEMLEIVHSLNKFRTYSNEEENY